MKNACELRQSRLYLRRSTVFLQLNHQTEASPRRWASSHPITFARLGFWGRAGATKSAATGGR